MFNLPERTIRRHLSEGLLKGNKVGGTWRFDDFDIKNYLDNPRIRVSSEKNNLKEVMDYVNGLSRHTNRNMILINRTNHKKNLIEKVTNYVNNIKTPFYLNVNAKGKNRIITFIGEDEHIINILKLTRDENEKNI